MWLFMSDPGSFVLNIWWGLPAAGRTFAVCSPQVIVRQPALYAHHHIHPDNSVCLLHLWHLYTGPCVTYIYQLAGQLMIVA